MNFIASKIIKPLHKRFNQQNRVRLIGQTISELLPESKTLTGLDVGCGDGRIAASLMKRRPQIQICGADVAVRLNVAIPTTKISDSGLPFPDNSFDFILLIDVLHHLTNPESLLLECRRVASAFIIVKDHYCEKRSDRWRLRLLDWLGNRGDNIALPYNYFSAEQWRKIFKQYALNMVEHKSRMKIYCSVLSVFFPDRLHFAAKLTLNKFFDGKRVPAS